MTQTFGNSAHVENADVNERSRCDDGTELRTATCELGLESKFPQILLCADVIIQFIHQFENENAEPFQEQ